MSKNAIARARYFANRKARRDQQNVFNKQNNLRPVSLRTMKKIAPPAPKPKIVKIEENKQIEISPAVVEKREKFVTKVAAPRKSRAKVKPAVKKVITYSKKVKITLNKPVAKNKNKSAATKTIKKVAVKKVKKAAPVKTKKSATKKIVKTTKKKK